MGKQMGISKGIEGGLSKS